MFQPIRAGDEVLWRNRWLQRRALENALTRAYNGTINHIIYNTMSTITANDLKTKGVSALETALEMQDEAIIRVRGKPRFVVMSIEHYEQLREAEIHAAWQEAREAADKGDYVVETAEEHIARLQKELAANAV